MANSYFAKVLSFRQASIGLSASVSRSVSAKSDATQTNIKPQISASAKGCRDIFIGLVAANLP